MRSHLKLALAFVCAVGMGTTVSAQTYSIGTNPQGSLAYATGAGVAKVVSEASGLKMRVVPQGGPVVTLPLVDKGELNFSIAASVVAAFGQTGAAMFKGRKQPNVRMVAALFPLRVGFFVRKDSDIKTLKDLKGKRLSVASLTIGTRLCGGCAG